MSVTTRCEQRCGCTATVYAIDPAPGGWGGRYCGPCADRLGFTITDRLLVTCDRCRLKKPVDDCLLQYDWILYVVRRCSACRKEATR